MRPKVYLIGVGMGNTDTLTIEAKRAIEASQVLLGAKRLLEAFRGKASHPLILSSEIVEFIKSNSYETIGILLSGDVGFYSGGTALRDALTFCDVESIAGISSLSYFCARLETAWQDVKIISVHGRQCNFIGEIQSNKRTFLLTGGKITASHVCREMCKNGLDEAWISVGENLSYPEESITVGTARKLQTLQFGNLAVMLVENPNPITRELAGIPDDEFVRGNVPMTKEEIRTLAVSKLKPKNDSIVWDIGAGTGSVSIQMALASPSGTIYAVEKNPEAVELIIENKEKFGTSNMKVISGTAPESLNKLPAPDRIFIGGSTGKLFEVLDCAMEQNSKVRFVVTAVTIETLVSAVEYIKNKGIVNSDIVQVSVTRTRNVGMSNMLTAQNPVWIISGEGNGE